MYIFHLRMHSADDHKMGNAIEVSFLQLYFLVSHSPFSVSSLGFEAGGGEPAFSHRFHSSRVNLKEVTAANFQPLPCHIVPSEARLVVWVEVEYAERFHKKLLEKELKLCRNYGGCIDTRRILS